MQQRHGNLSSVLAQTENPPHRNYLRLFLHCWSPFDNECKLTVTFLNLLPDGFFTRLCNESHDV